MKKIIPFLIIFQFIVLLSESFGQDVRINEIVSANSSGLMDAYGEYSDWIELKNFTNQAINLNGYFLSDNPDNPLKWSFPDVTINANGYLIIFASENNTVDNELHANFKLSKDGEELNFYNHLGLLVDHFDAVSLKADISYGRPSSVPNSMAFFENPTPGGANNTTAYQGVLSPPELNVQSGFYADPINVTASHPLSGVTFRYTIDGSEPNSFSAIYNGSWEFENIENEENEVSLIPTNPSFNYPVPGYDEDRANSRGWLPPFNLVNKVNVLKTKAFKSGYIASETKAASYFINEETSERYQFPVISLLTEPDHFFSDETGIYVYGTTGPEGNYVESGDEWERKILMQYFNNDGSLGFEQNFGARIHGGGGRHSAIKNLRIYARDDYGKSSLEFPFFSYDNTDEFKRFMVRGPGHRPDCTPRDDLADLLLQNLNMDIQHIQPVILFVNGEYWGIHTIKERFDQKYLELKYGKKDDDYVILRNSGTLDSGEEGDELPYKNLLEFVSTQNMANDENYEYVKSQIDIDNYLDYFSAEVFMGNVDWIISNIKFWRYKGFDKQDKYINGLDGKWRWFLYDFDLVFGGSCRNITPNVNVLEDAFDPEFGNATKLAIGLKQNQQFVDDFVNRLCDRMNTNFSASFFRKQLNNIDSMLTPHMMEHVNRWRYPSTAETLSARDSEVPTLTQWFTILEALNEYPDERKRKIIDHVTEEFNLNDTIHVELDVNDKLMGNIQINSIFISEQTDGVNDMVYPWHGTYFQNIPLSIIAVPKLGYRFIEWEETGDDSDTLIIDMNTSIKLTALFETDPDFNFDNALYINEFMASNKSTIRDEYEAFADWVEIYNPNNIPVDLASFYLSDDKSNPNKYQFERGNPATIIPPNGFKLIWCDNRTERGVLHTNFNLDASGEDIVLTAPDNSLIDEISYLEQSEDISYGRDKDGEDSWKYFEIPVGPTPGATNNNASISEINLPGITLYPNPVKRGENVYFGEQVDIRVFNLMGELVMEKNRTYSLKTNKLQKGVYLLQIDGKSNIKLIVQ